MPSSVNPHVYLSKVMSSFCFPVTSSENPSSLSAKVRKSLIGHIQDFSSDNVIKKATLSISHCNSFDFQNVLTPRQKIAIHQELEFRKQGFQPFSSETDGNVDKELSRTNTRNLQNFMFTKPPGPETR